ncbi:hypothetical protein AGMMS49944_15840 [Spirochaetia bacterium]|nr:hypothetical protein AGMMS49944_15840 [Spirochaetia bacterium]
MDERIEAALEQIRVLKLGISATSATHLKFLTELESWFQDERPEEPESRVIEPHLTV